MDEAKLKQLSDEVFATIQEVDSALDADEQRQLDAGQRVDAVVAEYRAFLAALDPKEKEKVEWTLGRRVTDLRRAADGLVKRVSGRAAERATDAGSVPFLEQRAPGRSIEPPRGPTPRKPGVGRDIQSWCGKCKEITDHRIVAMVGDEVKQVICDTCSSRHAYRAEPPVKARPAAAAGTTGGGKRGVSAEEREAKKRKEQRELLQRELAEASEARPFDPRARYKPGDIIFHPDHGRGKVENVLRSSLLVRFLEGLRPLNLD